jgi:hypothetical protein
MTFSLQNILNIHRIKIGHLFSTSAGGPKRVDPTGMDVSVWSWQWKVESLSFFLLLKN